MPINSKNFGQLAQTIFNDRLNKNDIIRVIFLKIPYDNDVELGNMLSNFVLLEPILNNEASGLSGRQLTPYYQLRFKTSLDLDNEILKIISTCIK